MAETAKVLTYLVSAFYLVLAMFTFGFGDGDVQKATYLILVSIVFMLMAIQATIEEKRKND